MKIIKVGKIKEFNRVKKCKYCKTIFIYSYRDLIEITDGIKYYDGVQCPICEELLRVSYWDRRIKIKDGNSCENFR